MQSERTLKEASHFFRDSHFSDCENHLCSRVQYCSWKVIVPFPWTINFLPVQLSFRSQWIASCLTFRHPSISGDHVSALWRWFLSFCWNLYRPIWHSQSLPHSLQLKEVLWGVSYTSTIFRRTEIFRHMPFNTILTVRSLWSFEAARTVPTCCGQNWRRSSGGGGGEWNYNVFW